MSHQQQEKEKEPTGGGKGAQSRSQRKVPYLPDDIVVLIGTVVLTSYGTDDLFHLSQASQRFQRLLLHGIIQSQDTTFAVTSCALGMKPFFYYGPAEARLVASPEFIMRIFIDGLP